MARKHHEGSAKDEREDRIGAKELGVSRKAYENTARDKAEDAAGEARVKVKPHTRKKFAPPPSPPPSSFGMAQAPGEANEPDDDDEGMGGL